MASVTSCVPRTTSAGRNVLQYEFLIRRHDSGADGSMRLTDVIMTYWSGWKWPAAYYSLL